MKNYKLNIKRHKNWVVLALLVLSTFGCQKDLLNTQPLTSLADASFWKTTSDATLALNGVYNTGSGYTEYNFWCATSMVNLDLMAGDGSEKESLPDHITDGTLTSANAQVNKYYYQTYTQITKCNNFLDHIDA